MKMTTPHRIASALLTVSVAVLGYGLWIVFVAVAPRPVPWTLILLIWAFAVGLLCACTIVTFPGKLNLAVVVTTTTVGFLVGNFVLGQTGRNLLDIVDTRLVRPFSSQKASSDRAVSVTDQSQFDLALPVDARTGADLTKDLEAAGFTINPWYNPHMLMELIALKLMPDSLYPLSSSSNKFNGFNSVTPGCTEGKPHEWPVFRKDRFGFNNDDLVYSHKNLFMVVGSSFAQGSCVQQYETIQGVLTRSGYPTITTGIGGSGALGALAALKEYGEYFKPKVVLWQFYDPNDITILSKRDLRSAFLLQYVKDGFTQNLVHRQDEVDAFWRTKLWAPANTFYDDPKKIAEWDTFLDKNLPLVQELLGKDISSLSDDEDLLKIYKRILALAKLRVSAWGGKIYLVMIPNEDLYVQKTIPKYQRTVKQIMSALGIETIDIDESIRQAGNFGQFFADPKGWSHFNAEGYHLMSRQIMDRLNHDLAERVRASMIDMHR